jgi:hypothetical protein
MTGNFLVKKNQANVIVENLVTFLSFLYTGFAHCKYFYSTVITTVHSVRKARKAFSAIFI